MHMSSKLHGLSAKRAHQLSNRAQPQYEAYLGMAKGHSQALEAAVAILESKASVASKRKADGEVFRGAAPLAQSTHYCLVPASFSDTRHVCVYIPRAICIASAAFQVRSKPAQKDSILVPARASWPVRMMTLEHHVASCRKETLLYFQHAAHGAAAVKDFCMTAHLT